MSRPEMVKRGEIDEATIGADILDSWLADEATKDMVSMDRPNTNYTYFYLFNFMPFYHEFSNQTVEGIDEEYEPENWAKAINSTNFRKAFLYGINNAVTLAVNAPEGYEGYMLNTVTPPSFCANDDGVTTPSAATWPPSPSSSMRPRPRCTGTLPSRADRPGRHLPGEVQLPYNPATHQLGPPVPDLQAAAGRGAERRHRLHRHHHHRGSSDNYLSAVRRAGKYCFQLCNWGR